MSGGKKVASTIGLWHRILVDGIAESRALRGRSGKDAAWFRYEHHARARAGAAARHARWRRAIGARMGRQGT